jgi:hypothetical protein
VSPPPQARVQAIEPSSSTSSRRRSSFPKMPPPKSFSQSIPSLFPRAFGLYKARTRAPPLHLELLKRPNSARASVILERHHRARASSILPLH